jgi:Holliday junction resolvase RusA-like endonuclease
MSIHIQFFAQGEPKGQPRPRAFSRGGHARVYDPGTAEGWKSQIAVAAKEHIPFAPIEQPVRVKAVFYFPRPKSHYRTNGNLKDTSPTWHTSRPDGDNCIKCILDALTTLQFWTDDALVAECEIIKKYVQGKTYAPGAMIEIREAVL